MGYAEETVSSRNCYLFCLVCFSICMNISQTVHFQFMIFSLPFICPFLQIARKSHNEWVRASVCANIPAEWRPHIILFFCSVCSFVFVFVCFSFMQRHRNSGYARELNLIWSVTLSLKTVDRRNRHCNAYVYTYRIWKLIFLSFSLSITLSLFVCAFFFLIPSDLVDVVTCASMMMYVALESFCQFQRKKKPHNVFASLVLGLR